jgi:hypothetical protein
MGTRPPEVSSKTIVVFGRGLTAFIASLPFMRSAADSTGALPDRQFNLTRRSPVIRSVKYLGGFLTSWGFSGAGRFAAAVVGDGGGVEGGVPAGDLVGGVRR